MRKSKGLEKIRNSRCARVCGLGHYLPFYVRYAAHYGYDVVWLDLEHRAMDDSQVQSLIALCHYNNIDCMVRTPTLQRTRLYRYFEDGAAGLMVPFTDTAATARQVVEAVKFPPLGNRGIDGAGLDADYGIAAWQEGSSYLEDANSETFVVVQIETPQALENVEEIAAVPGVDVLFVGPADLGTRLALDSNGPSLDEAIARVAATAKSHGKAWGLPAGTPEAVQQYSQMGAQFLVHGGDFALMNVLEESSKAMGKALGE
ncbi:MAG: 4-hydroxy-2-oxovalerate aldolase [Candidatus Latescibacteria bacterium]|nr:4-hydroxy-2-oxovalerate aldolase [Candidatus Latescibacterota bacterium]